MAVVRTAARLCLIALTLSPVNAQGLAEAARQAQELRQAADAQGTAPTKLSISSADGDLQEVVLTDALFDRYAAARATLGRVFARDRSLYERMRAAMDSLPRARTAVALYEREPKLKREIEFHGFRVAGFVDLVLTMQRADARAHAARLDPPVSPLQSANTTFMHEHCVAIRALEHTLGASDSWLLPMPSARLPY